MSISNYVWEFLFQVVNLLLVLGVLYKVLYKRLGEVIRKREDFVQNTLSEARQAKEEAEKMLAEYADKLENSKQEAREIIDRAERTGEEMKRQRIEEAREEASRMLEKAKAEIATERELALKAIRDEVAAMAVEAAERILRESVKDKEHRKLEKEFLNKVGELK